jgi:hypothetical protein
MVTRYVKRIFETTDTLSWPGQIDIYAKSTNHAPQKKYVLLESGAAEMRLQLEAIWHKARLRKHGHASFMLLLFVYLPRRRTQRLTSLRRATDSRIREQLPRVVAHMQECQIDGGLATQRYAAISLARLPDDAAVQVPGNETFRQLQHIDRQAATVQGELQEQDESDQGYHLIRARLHGVVVPIFLHVADMREALGLPPYSLRPPFRPPRYFDTPDPQADMEDADHAPEPDDRS